MISFCNVSKTYDSKIALQSFNNTFVKNQTHILLGSSGCGKTTLLKLMAQLIEPTHGSIEYDSSFGENPLQKMGYVLQEGGLFPHLTGFDNVALKARTLKWSEEKIKKRMEELIQLVQLKPHVILKFPQNMSGGQRQRVSLMRALFLDPLLVLLDEPLGALDPIVRRGLQQELKELFVRLNKTVVMVTHDVAEAAYLGDQIYLFHEGQLIQQGKFQDFVSHPKTDFVKKFFEAQNFGGPK